MKKRFLFGLCLGFLSLRPASAYVLENIVWNIADPTIFVNLTASQGKLGANLASFPLQDGSADYNSVFKGAVQTWNGYLGDLQIQTRDGTSASGFDTGNNLCETGFGTAVDGSSLGNDILAVTEIYFDQGTPDTFAPTDIVFSSNYAWNSYRGPLLDSPIDLRRVALHELGHFIGLDHPDEHGQSVSAIMNSVISNTDNLTADDIAGGQAIYGGPVSPTEVPTYGDFDGDGRGDLLWFNSQTGQVVVWLMNGPTIVANQVVGTMGLDWQVTGVLDLDGDGKADIIWHQTNTANYQVWYMNGANVRAVTPVYPQANDTVNLFGDLDGDGRADLLQYSPVYGALSLQKNVNGAFVIANGFNVPVAWVPLALADLDGNGQKEIIWRNKDTGEVGAWYLSNYQLTGVSNFGVVDRDWRLRGVGRFNGRATDSLVWHNLRTGEVGLWNFDAGNLSVQLLPLAGLAPWDVFGVADLNGNHAAAIVWFNPDTASVGVWTLDGSTATPYLLNGGLGAWRLQPDPGN